MRNVSRLVVPVLFSACFSPVVERQCDIDSDCGSNYVCESHQCVPARGSSGGGDAQGNGGGTARGGGPEGGGKGGGISGNGGGQGAECSAKTCRDGCCQMGRCMKGDSHAACGSNGQFCVSCFSVEVCDQRKCVPGNNMTFDAGMSTVPVGKACDSANQCGGTPGFCLFGEVAGIKTGYVGGYCTQTCTSTDPKCPVNSVCITEMIGGFNSMGCKTPCANPGKGQDTCRQGYLCLKASSGDMTGWCGPSCINQTIPCLGGTRCNAMTGYCE